MSAVLFYCPWENRPLWLQTFAELAPQLELREWPDVGNPDEIDYALVWDLPAGVLKTLPKLRAVSSLGAGVDHIFADPDLPPDLPVERLVYPLMIQRMSEYVLLSVLRYQRRLDEYVMQQKRREFRILQHRDASELRIGILGLGMLGADAASKLAYLGYNVLGWSRSPKSLEDVTSFVGERALDEMLAQTDILICLLPLNTETAGILNQRLFNTLPKGASLVNCARGGHLVESDLIAALNSGHLSHATLDAFSQEPLPADHPFWDHPRIHVTPHVSSLSNVRAAVPQVLENIRRVREGLEPLHRVHPK